MKNKLQNSEILSENEKISIKEMIENALLSKEKFPVDFNNFWQWAGYSRKDSAKRTLKKFFKENKDFLILDEFSTEFSTQFSTQKAKEGRPEKGIKLTLDCAINLSLKANSVKSNFMYDFMIICKENFELNHQDLLQNVENQYEMLLLDEKQAIKNCVIERELNEFCVDFEQLIQWLNYTRKDTAKKTLERNFIFQKDFNLRHMAEVQIEGKRTVNRPKEVILLTIECAKSFAMLAQTEKGKQVRNYFLQCEKELFEIIKNPTKQPSNNDAEDKFDLLSQAISKNETTLEKIGDAYTTILERLDKNEKRTEINEKRIEVLENENIELKKRISFLEKNSPKKNVFVLIVVLDNETTYYRIFTKQNPVFIRENQKTYFEEFEVFFFMEFDNEEDCKNMEDSILNIFKVRNLHVQDDFFCLQKKHFQLFEVLEFL